jgi:transposase
VIGSTRQVAVWAYGAPADLRKGFDGLSALVAQGLGRDPLSGDCYLFVERHAQAGQGAAVGRHRAVHLRQGLEQGRFACLWRDAAARVVRLTMSELQLFLEGSTLVGRIALSPAPFVVGEVRKDLASCGTR